MTTIMNIPQEVFNIILGYNDITVEDIINFRCACKQFRWIAKYDKYMEKKFSQRWSSAKKVYDKEYKQNVQEKSKGNEQKDKEGLSFMETGINCARKLRNTISLILCYFWQYQFTDNYVIDNSMWLDDALFYDDLRTYITDITDTTDKDFEFDDDEFIDNDTKNYNDSKYLLELLFCIDEFKNLFTQRLQTDYNLTEKYYLLKLYHYMRQCMIEKKLKMFMRQSYKYLIWERVFTMIAQFLQPEKDIFYSNVEAALDNIASEVLNCLKKKHPDHSIFSISPEIRSYWKKNNIHDNHWNETEGTEIMNTLHEYIFSKFSLNKWRVSPDTKVEYVCIDSVLRNKIGQELIFLTIHHCVARRLGLRCDIANMDSHFFIIWDSKYPYNLRDGRYFNLWLFQFLPSHYPYVMKPSWHSIILFIQQSMTSVGEGCLDNISHKFLTNYFECSNSNSLKFHVSTSNLHPRSEDVKFAVGMIVTHEFECVGVIVGWHRHFDNHYIRIYSSNVACTSDHIQTREMPLIHCSNYNFLKEQTNYIILTENNKMCYVEEDALTLTTPRWINNSEIGRYFCKFEGTHYVPNERLANHYPDDAAITATLQ